MENVQIPLTSLVSFLIFCLVVVAGVFLIIMIYNITQFIKRATKILESNSENINKTLTLLPEATQNVNDVALSLKSNIEKVENAVGNVEDAVVETVAAVTEGTENVLNYVKIFSEIINIILGTFSSKRK